MKKHCGRTYRKRRNKKIKPSAVSNVPTEANQNLSLLLKWMGMKGFKAAKKLHPAIFIDTGRGLMTKDSINSGDLIVAIPQNLLITPHKVLKSHLGNFFKRYCPQASGHQILSVFLICEKCKGVSSDWCHYIETLPKIYSIPAYLNQHSLSAIPEFLIGQALDQVMLCKNSYEQLKLLLQNLEASCHLFKGALDFDVYKWAWCSVNTRCIYIDCDKNHCIGNLCTYHLALAPFLDLLNHSAHVQVHAGFNDETKCYEIISQCQFKKYSQIFINYGQHSNRKLFLEYGFIVSNNYNDSIPISIADIKSAYAQCNLPSELFPCKLKFIHSNNLHSYASCTCDGLSWNLNLILGILALDYDIKWWQSRLADDHEIMYDNNAKFRKLRKKLISMKLNEYKLNSHVCICCSDVQTLVSTLCAIEKSILIKCI